MSAFANLLAELPLMTPARAELLLSAFWPMLKAVVGISIPLALSAFVVGMAIAVVVAVLRSAPVVYAWQRPVNAVLGLYLSMVRGTPLLVQLCIVFYGLPAVGVYIDPIPAAIIGFSLHFGAYESETVRAAIVSVPKGQWEAGYTIGMNYRQTFTRIIAPQAFRVAVPPLSNAFITLFKNTSLASIVTVTEMFRVAQQYANNYYDFLPVYIEAAFIYWCFCWVLFRIQQRLEERLGRHVHRH